MGHPQRRFPYLEDKKMIDMAKIYAQWFTARLDLGDRAATAVEYGLFVALIAAIIVVTVKSIGTKTQTGFNTVDTALP